MAQVARKSKPPSRPASPAKRPVGRPPGSKNKVPGEAPGKAAAGVSKAAPALIRKNASPASKLSKADLEAQVVKLERALALSRKKVAELKWMMSEPDARADQAAVDKPAASIAEPKALKQKPAQLKQKLAATRGSRKKAEAAEQDEPALDEATGEAETEAHAS